MDLVDPLVLFGTILFIYISISLTLNLEFGLTGVPNFGKALFVAAGGMLGALAMYRVGLYVFHLHSNDIFESSPFFSAAIQGHLATDPMLAVGFALIMIIVGGLAAAALGYLSSYPAIRLREDYLGMLLLGAAELFAVITASYQPLVGGPENFTAPNVLAGFGEYQKYAILCIFAAFAILVYVYAERVAKSPLGRTLKAVRDNEIASESLGKDNVNIRRKMLVTASALSGMAGALWVMYWTQIGSLIGGDAGGTFPRLLYTFYPFTIVILGGIASNLGVIVGALALTTVYVVTTEVIPGVVTSVNIPGVNANLLNTFVNSLSYIIIGGLLLTILLLRPEGLIRERPTFALSRDKLRKIADTFMGEEDGGAKKEEGTGGTG